MMKKVFWLAALLFTFLTAGPSSAQESGQDVFTPIGKYLQSGDYEKLSAWFADNLELDIGEKLFCKVISKSEFGFTLRFTARPAHFDDWLKTCK